MPDLNTVRRLFPAWLWKGSLMILILLCLVWAAATWLLPAPLARFLVEQTQTQLGRRLTLDAVRIAPASLQAQIEGIRLFDADGRETALSASSLQLGLSLSSLWRGALVVDHLHLQALRLHLRTTPGRDGLEHNFRDVLERIEAAPPAAHPLRLILQDAGVHDGQIDWEDRASGQRSQLSALTLHVPHLEVLPAATPTPFVARMDARLDGAPFLLEMHGAMPAAHAPWTISAQLAQANATRYAPLWARHTGMHLQSGMLDLNLRAEWPEGLQRPLQLSGQANLTHALVEDAQHLQLAAVERVQITLERMQPALQRLHLKAVRVDAPRLWLRRDAQGRVLPPFAAPDATPIAAQVSSPATRMQIQLDTFDLRKGALTVAAAGEETSIQIADLAVQVHDWSSDGERPARVQMGSRVGEDGRIEAQGDLHWARRQLDLQVQAAGVPLVWANPYLASSFAWRLARGVGSIDGVLQLRAGASAAPDLHLTGKMTLEQVQFQEHATHEPLLQWRSVRAEGLNVQRTAGAAPRADLEDLLLDGIEARAVLSAQGKLNLRSLQDGQALPALPAASTESRLPWRWRIARTRLSNGTLAFTDHFIKPSYHVDLSHLQGNLGSLDSQAQAAETRIELQGKIDEDAPFLLSGVMAPLAQPPFLDLKGSTNGIELTRLTPYSTRYAGYPIEKGQLSAQVHYRVHAHTLSADNQLHLDQLTFGAPIEGEGLTHLPVRWLVALLQDKNGKIDINLPVSGSLDDPEFSLSGVLFKVAGNLVGKMLTSPFAFLGGWGTQEAQLSHLDFPPGEATLDSSAQQRLDQLAQALQNRPGLKLDITGFADAALDAAPLARHDLERMLREQAAQEGRAPTSEPLAPAERRRQLEQAWRAQAAPGAPLPDSVEILSQALLARTPVDDDALRSLAAARADAARDYLEYTGHIAHDRLFLIAPRLNAVAAASRAPGQRGIGVEFALK